MARLRAAARPRPSVVLAEHRSDILRLVHQHRAVDSRVFGSVARGTDSSGSDLDLVVRFTPDASMYDLVELREELQDLLGVPVDLISEAALGADQLAIETLPL